jgi:hypothetical protein
MNRSDNVTRTSPDGRAKAMHNRYQVDGGAWITWGGSNDDAKCIVHTAQPDVTTTTTFTMY